MTTSDFTFYGKADYFADLARRIGRAKSGSTVTLATMSFIPTDDGIPAVVDALCEAAGRGVRVELAVDAYNFLLSKHKIVGPLWFSGELPRSVPAFYREKLAALERLKASGGHYTVTNVPARPFMLPFGGRSHIKYSVVDDYVYVGGCNLNTSRDIDLMAGWQDEAAAAWLRAFATDVRKGRNVRKTLQGRDVTERLGSNTELLIDAGVPKQSVIYKKALELIDEAQESVFITCQFFPNSTTTRHLVAAHRRGVDITVLFNHPSQHRLHYPLQQAVVWREQMRSPKVFFAHQLPRGERYLHAKLIATERGAIIGSHNYVTAGVNFGTAEIALLRHDPEFALAALRSLHQELSSRAD